jgi:capsule polysaccharide export protein KpsC/LpsZ
LLEFSMALSSAIMTVPNIEGAAPHRAFVGGTYWWNYPIVRGLFSAPAGEPTFCRSIDDAIARARLSGGRVIAWAARLEPRHESECAALGLELVRIEDGFIRSIGLGAGFTGAASLAVDMRGIYYDPGRPSDLEHLLQTTVLSDAERVDGARIRRRIIELGLTKYNLHRGKTVVVRAGARRIILIPGQVADDASVLNSMSRTIDAHAGENINLQLLKRARARHPDAYLIFKPHPDVRYRLRVGSLSSEVTQKLADLVVEDVDIAELIEMCDGVETISSLAGFEALLRGKSVTVHGLPFYAGWGLTTDIASSPRRSARRTIEELCYIALVNYTRHVNPATGEPCTIFELLDALDTLRASRLHRFRISGLHCFARLCESLAKTN